MPLTGGYLHPYMFSLQLYHGSSVLPNISALCWWSPLWGVLPAALHYIFPLFRFSQKGLCHLAVLGPKCYLTSDNSSNHYHHNITSGIISCGDLFLSLSSGHEREPIWNNTRWQICCTSSQTATPFFSPTNPRTDQKYLKGEHLSNRFWACHKTVAVPAKNYFKKITPLSEFRQLRSSPLLCCFTCITSLYANTHASKWWLARSYFSWQRRSKVLQLKHAIQYCHV